MQSSHTTKSSALYSNSASCLFKSQIKPVIKRTIQTVARTQSVTIPKPVIKFTPGGSVNTTVTAAADNSNQQQSQSPQQQQWKSNVQQVVQQPVVQTVMEIDEPPASLIKRKMSDDDR